VQGMAARKGFPKYHLCSSKTEINSARSLSSLLLFWKFQLLLTARALFVLLRNPFQGRYPVKDATFHIRRGIIN
jgi:hypothetical protein